jgi:predicted small secreted protein
MVKRILLSIILIFVVFILIGCNTAEGLKGDITFIGDKTTEILDK